MLPLEIVPETGSTQTDLKAREQAGSPECALMARCQTQGHGRLGRPWSAPDGNLALSVLLRPQSLRWPGHWSLLAAVALLDAIRQTVPAADGLRLKWPNDILRHQAKLAGILLESGTGRAGPWLVLGFGVNIASAPRIPGRRTASLDAATTPDVMARALLHALATWRTRYATEGFAPIAAAWLAAGPAAGDPIRLANSPDEVGHFDGLAHDGALCLDDGRVIHGGELLTA